MKYILNQHIIFNLLTKYKWDVQKLADEYYTNTENNPLKNLNVYNNPNQKINNTTSNSLDTKNCDVCDDDLNNENKIKTLNCGCDNCCIICLQNMFLKY